MVMHARKIPRLSDGYYDKNQAHPFEEKYPSKSLGSSHGERYESSRSRESPSYRGNRDYSPSRSSSRGDRNRHLERAKEKGSTSSPVERRPNHYASASSNHERGNSRPDRDRNNESKPTASSSKDHKIEFQKSALRVSGDWSEHRSSSGKKYYYNCRTEVSQWEKPKDWIDLSSLKVVNDSARSRDKNGREGTSRPVIASSKSYDERYRHSNSSSSLQRGGPSATQTSPYGRSGYNAVSEQRLPSRQDSHDYRSRNSDSRDMLGQLSGRRDVVRTTSLDERAMHKMDEMHVANRAHHRHELSFNGARPMSTTPRNDNEDSRQTEDMDISPDNTPHMSSRPTSRHGTPAASTPSSSIATTVANMASAISHVSNCQMDPRQHHGPMNAHHSMTPISSSSTVNPTLTETIETLKRLQEALLAQQQHVHKQHPPVHHHAQPNMVNSTPHCVISPALRSPQVSAHLPNRHPSTLTNSRNSSMASMSLEEDGRLMGSPPHENNYRASTRESPTSSMNNMQGMSGHIALSAAAVSRKPDSIQLTPSLLNHFDEKLIGHVTGWPTEPLERHADRFSEEINGPGCIQCSRVIVELKKARSMVRIAEILSTPKEQRVLFLRQQIKDLENMKGQSCYMSYQDT